MNDFLTTIPVAFVFVVVAQLLLRVYPATERPLLWLSFAFHQLASVCHILIMDLYYGYGDMFGYAERGQFMAAYLRADFLAVAPNLIDALLQRESAAPLPLPIPVSSTGSMQAIASFAMFFFNDSLYAASAAIAGLAFIAKLALFSVVKHELPNVPKRSLLLTCMFVPSAVFWSTALLKEPIAMIGLCAAVYAWRNVLAGRRGLGTWFALGLGSSTIILVKGYIFPALCVGMGVWWLLQALNTRHDGFVLKLWHIVALMSLMLVAIVGIGYLMPEFALDALEEQLASQQAFGERLKGGSSYTLGDPGGGSGSPLLLAPLGLLTALFRPLLIEARSALILVSALEMTAFTAFTCVAVYRHRLNIVAEVLRQPFLGFCAVFMVVFGTGVGLATTNLGTLARYRMPLIPFFAVLLVTLARRSSVDAKSSVGAQPPLKSGVQQSSAVALRSTRRDGSDARRRTDIARA